jgi:hypothetical protein
VTQPIDAKRGVKIPVAAAKGPLRVHPANGRYFTDGSEKAIYLTGSHTWANLSDGFFYAPNQDPPNPFDYEAYLKLLQEQNHNFIRLWSGIVVPKAKYDTPFAGTHYPTPLPYARTGPGDAQDGKPRFDLTKFNQGYFDRLRSRVIAAGERGIYVSIMLFEGIAFVEFEGEKSWDFHPFNIKNNINGINGDPNGDDRGLESLTLQVPAITDIQKAHVRKVIDTVNDLDNVLFEIANEAATSRPATVKWQYEMISYVREYEATRPKQHAVGMTAIGGTGVGNDVLFNSSADWISPDTSGHDNTSIPYISDPPAADGRKVSILDSDHLFYSSLIEDGAGVRAWVWKSFARGHNPILMEDMSNSAGWVAGRAAMGHTRSYANKMNLAAMTPQEALASTKYCLANPGKEYLVYVPEGGEVTVDLSAAKGTLAVEWFNPSTAVATNDGPLEGGAKRTLKSPFEGDAVLYIVENQDKQ